MNFPSIALTGLTVSAICALAWSPALAQTVTEPSIPVGTLSAAPTVVQTGTKPTLTWSISYPSVVKDYITITPPATVVVKQDLICDVRVLGAGVTTQNSNGSINYIETKGQIRYNGLSSWNTIFDGKETDSIVQKQGIIKTYNVTANRAMDFAGQYYYNNTWSTQRTSLNGDFVKALVNGDACPTKIPDYNAPSLASFLKPYLDASNHVKIGPMDMIIFMELTHTNTADIGYDEQDLVFLVTFRTS